LRKCVIGRVENIVLVDLYDPTPYFKEVMTSALELIKNADPRRFSRVQRYIHRIVQTSLSHKVASYRTGTKTCCIDFLPVKSAAEVPGYAAWYACTLVHEATHGWLFAHGVDYGPTRRLRVEKLCVTEECRLMRRLKLSPVIAEWLEPSGEFNPEPWQRYWRITWWRDLLGWYRSHNRRQRESAH
jgi:hypothetical protein